jgi:hypothetical protein
MSEALINFIDGEYDYLQKREGSDFFLALAPYIKALQDRPEIDEILKALEREMHEALQGIVDEQNEMIEEAKEIRVVLAERAPEIDNSDMEPPDHASHYRAKYELDSLANFDRIADADSQIGYPTVPRDNDDPGPVSTLLIILRGRLRAAVFGEEAEIDAEKVRDDLDDLARRIANLAERHRASSQRYRYESRTLPGMAYARLVYFGSDLVREAAEIQTDEDLDRLFDRTLREWGKPKTLVRKLVNAEQLDDWESRSVVEVEATLKREAERLHREVSRRLPSARAGSTALAPIEAASVFDEASDSGLRFTEFVELMLARLAEADRERPGEFVDLVLLTEELRQDFPLKWIFDARDALEDRGLVQSVKVFGRTAPAMLTAQGRLHIERGNDSDIISEYKEHRSNFVIVSGSGHQVAIGVEGDVRQTALHVGVPREAFDLLDRIEQEIAADQMLDRDEREAAIEDVRSAREQLQRKEPNKRAALALLDPLSKIAAIGGFVAKIVSLLA